MPPPDAPAPGPRYRGYANKTGHFSARIPLRSAPLPPHGYIAINAGLAEYVDSIVPDMLKASGQMRINFIVVSLGRILGSLCGGGAMERFALGSIFLFLSGFWLVAVPAFRAAGRHAFDESVKFAPLFLAKSSLAFRSASRIMSLANALTITNPVWPRMGVRSFR